jgi:hypothetical protein
METASPPSGAIFGEDHLAVRLDDGSWRGLGHPGESRELEKVTGLTWKEACRAGRLQTVVTTICRNCGTLGEQSHVIGNSPLGMPFGCLAPIVGGPLGFLAGLFVLHWVWHRPLLDSLFLALCGSLGLVSAILILSILIGRAFEWLRRKVRPARKAESPPPCPKCGGGPVVRLRQAQGENLPCPCCGCRSLRVSPFAIA